MVEAGKRHDLPSRGKLDGPAVGGVLLEREVRSSLMVVGEVPAQDAAEVLFAEDEDVIHALAPDRADGFCHGLCGAVRTSSMPMPFTRWRNC
jgi:hypothetical protein